MPYREATELQECIRVMDDEEFCRREVLGVCTPGPRRDVALQPVFFRSADNDPSPTGASWGHRLGAANTIWGKLGVSFTASSPVVITDPVNKVAGGSAQERTAIRALHSGSGIEVFMMDNDLPAPAGGGATTPRQGGDTSKVVLSDRGASRTLLAHELGHVLGLGHPPGGADADTIMQPSGSHASENPWRNTLGNLQRITWPQASGITCIAPDA